MKQDDIKRMADISPFKTLCSRAKALATWLMVIWLMFSTTMPAWAGQDINKTFHAKAYSGSRAREYIVHVPTGYQENQPIPLVMVLHGCQETHKTIRHDTKFNRLADREGFAVIYPFITRYNGLRSRNCWGFWFKEHIHEGKGEVQDLRAMVEEVQRDYNIDPNRIHITGLSSGGGMAVAAMVAHSELFASGSTTAGLPYSETALSVGRNCFNPGIFKPLPTVVAAMKAEIRRDPPAEKAKRIVPLLAIHSENDCTVNIQASYNLRDSFLKLWQQTLRLALAEVKVTQASGVTKGTPWNHQKYFVNSSNTTIIETFFVKGLPHGWYGDRNGQYAFANAPDTTQLVWEFFKHHPFEVKHNETEKT